MPVVRTGPLTGLAMQFALLTTLALTTGLGAGGWLAGIAYGIFVCAALTWGLNRSGGAFTTGSSVTTAVQTRPLPFGPANWVTLTRACLAGGVTALTVDAFAQQTPVALLVGLCVSALILDAVDGYVARQTNTASQLGARFDMEVDAFLILVLSVYVSRDMGAWVLIIGMMRYAYLVATWLVPWLPGQLPPRYWRKVVAAIQGIVLVIAAADVLPSLLTTIAVLAALGLLTESFGRDIWWRWQDRPSLTSRRHHLEIQHESV